jgi:UDP-MurNAc hydroxylase
MLASGIPFASNHCFLHRETKAFNSTSVSPEMVRDYFDAHKSSESQSVAMILGDSWSNDCGFELQQHDCFRNRGRRLAESERQYAVKLDEYYHKE